MTNKQAIEILNRIRCSIHEDSIEEQALVYAIEALEFKQKIIDNGYTGKEAEFRIGGRLFGIREKAQ